MTNEELQEIINTARQSASHAPAYASAVALTAIAQMMLDERTEPEEEEQEELTAADLLPTFSCDRGGLRYEKQPEPRIEDLTQAQYLVLLRGGTMEEALAVITEGDYVMVKSNYHETDIHEDFLNRTLYVNEINYGVAQCVTIENEPKVCGIRLSALKKMNVTVSR